MSTPSKPPTSRRPADVVALPDRKLAKSVAKELERRGRRRKLLLVLLLVGAIALALQYGTCGHGWGLGKGKGEGEGKGPGQGSVQGVMTVLDAGPKRCALVLSATGLTVDGKAATRDEAIAVCKTTTGADLVIMGDAAGGDRDDLYNALQEAKIAWTEHKPGRPVDGSAAPSGSAGSPASGSAAPTSGSAAPASGSAAGATVDGAGSATPTEGSAAASSTEPPAGAGSGG